MLKIDFENQLLALFEGYFLPFNKSHEKIKSIFVISESYLQSEMFLSNSIDMMKNLLKLSTNNIGHTYVQYF